MAIFLPFCLLSENLVDDRINVLFLFVWMDMEIRIAGQHRGQLGFCPVVEYVAGLSDLLGIGEFITDTE